MWPLHHCWRQVLPDLSLVVSIHVSSLLLLNWKSVAHSCFQVQATSFVTCSTLIHLLSYHKACCQTALFMAMTEIPWQAKIKIYQNLGDHQYYFTKSKLWKAMLCWFFFTIAASNQFFPQNMPKTGRNRGGKCPLSPGKYDGVNRRLGDSVCILETPLIIQESWLRCNDNTRSRHLSLSFLLKLQ